MDKYEQEKYLRSIELFQAIVFNYPGEALVDTAQYYLALSYFGNKDYPLAGVEFNRLLINYPSSVYAVQAQLLKAVCFFEATPEHYGLDQSDLEIAIQQFEDFIIDYPESEAVGDARQYLSVAKTRMAKKLYKSGIVYTRIGDYRAAEVYFQKVVDEYTDTEFAPLATYQIAEGNYQRKKWNDAHEGFQSFVTVFADHEWAGRAAERSCQAAFKGGEEAFRKGDYSLAQTRFERFKILCADDEDKLKEADQYLREIGDRDTAKVQEEHAGP
jgi:outer membrane protein assembly factor BamD